MAQYGDAVILVKKSGDGEIHRLNAIVLGVSVHAPIAADRKVIKKLGKPLEAEEHLDLAFARQMPPGHALKSHDMGLVFQPAYDVRPWGEGLYIGWENPRVSETETKIYSDGTTATGPGPLPELSPAQQDAQTDIPPDIA
jgi:hypothetical protein